MRKQREGRGPRAGEAAVSTRDRALASRGWSLQPQSSGAHPELTRHKHLPTALLCVPGPQACSGGGHALAAQSVWGDCTGEGANVPEEGPRAPRLRGWGEPAGPRVL